MSQSSTMYRIDPAPIFLFSYIVGSIACSAFVVLLAIFDPSFQRAGIPVILETVGYVLVFFGPPYAALCALVLTHYFRYELTPDGVKGFTMFGGSVFIEWTHVTAVRPARIGNLEFVRLTPGHGRRSVWFPMFVRGGSALDPTAPSWSAMTPLGEARNAPAAARTGS